MIKNLSALFLIFANLVPLLGVWKFGWSIPAILVLYWFEGIIIGVLNIPRILATQGKLGVKLFTTAFFTVHYGLFAMAHGSFLAAPIFGAGAEMKALLAGGPLFWTGLSFFASHLVSFFIRLGQGEFRARNPMEQMMQPYSRVVIMHLVVLFGGAAAIFMGAPLGALLILIGLKIALDLMAHKKDAVFPFKRGNKSEI